MISTLAITVPPLPLVSVVTLLIVVRILSARYKTRYINNKLDFLFQSLIKEKIVNVEARLSNATLLKANNMIKKYKDNLNLQNAITAFKVGIPYELLLKHLDFSHFARVNAIHRYLLVYNHELRYDHDTIWILYEGLYCDWRKISKYVMSDARKELKGQYSRNGIIHNYLFEWDTLMPFLRALKENEVEDLSNISTGLPVPMKHDWGDRYILEICAWIVSNPRLTGDHLWHRLKTPLGDVYSVGQYRPRKLQGHEQFVFPMKIKTSQFFSPDLCEFWTGPYTTLSVEITASQFHDMKRKMELDQMRQEHIYQLFEDNCVDYTMSICKIAGVFFSTKIPISDILIRNERLKKAKYSIWNSNILPDFVKLFWHYTWVFLINGISLILGAGLIDPEVKENSKSVTIEPFIKDLKDFADADKVLSNHPFVVGGLIREEIEEWRTEQQKLLFKRLSSIGLKGERDAIEKEIENLRYAVPPKFRFPVTS